MLALAGAWVPAVWSAPAGEMRVQAAYVLNFIRYSRWPEPADGPLVIAVLGTPDNAAELKQIAQRAGTVHGRPLSVRLLPLASLAPGQDEAVAALTRTAGQAHVLYVGTSHHSWARVVGTVSSGRPMLTIGPGAGFLAKGGMFAMYVEQGNVRFAVNAPAIKASSVDVSAKLLTLARPVRGG